MARRLHRPLKDNLTRKLSMSMIISSLKRRNEALQTECDNLAQGIDHLSAQLTEAYELLTKYEPDYVDAKLNPNRPPAAAAPETPAGEPPEAAKTLI
jgi:hypothetical protein